MKNNNEKKFIDLDTVYVMAVSLFGGTLAVGVILASTVEKFF